MRVIRATGHQEHDCQADENIVAHIINTPRTTLGFDCCFIAGSLLVPVLLSILVVAEAMPKQGHC